MKEHPAFYLFVNHHGHYASQLNPNMLQHPCEVIQLKPFPGPGLRKQMEGVSINGGTPIAGWFIRENPIEIDDFRGYPPF